MKQKTQEYVQFIKENHKNHGGQMNGAAVSKELGISQGRVSQILKEIGDQLANSPVQPVNQEATASTAEA